MATLVLAIFANDAKGTLGVVAERDALRKLFNDDSKIEFKALENATAAYLYDTLIKRDTQQRTIILHFGCHADEQQLYLLDGGAAVNGMTRLSAMLPNLQLVFLNACETFEQADKYLASGARAVIATLQPVKDEIAIAFASNFYSAYYNLNTLNDSFEFAKGKMLLQYNSVPFSFVKSVRGVVKYEEGDKGGQNMYRLDVRDERQMTKTILFDVDIEPDNEVEFNYAPCEKLIIRMSQSIMDEDSVALGVRESIREKFNNFKRNPQSRSSLSDLSQLVLNMLPYPIGVHISRLVGLGWQRQDEEKRRSLLLQQITTYNTSIQLLSYTMLTCFWKALVINGDLGGCRRNEELDITEGQWKVLRDFMSTNELNNTNINFPVILITIREIFEKNNIQPFISNYQMLREVFEDKESFMEAHLFMQGLRSSIENGEIRKMNIKWLCYKAENILCKIFSQAGIITRYKLTTVKNIEFSKSRMKSPSYRIRNIKLDKSTGVLDDIESYDEYTDTHSVILVKGRDPKEFTQFISLSPFIIDENSLKDADLSKLYFYSHREDDAYVYRGAEDHNDWLRIKKENTYQSLFEKSEFEVAFINQRMSAIYEEMEAFNNLINQ